MNLLIKKRNRKLFNNTIRINKKIKFSVIIVSYNQEKYIDQALQSVLNQKCDFKYEIIISDDGSTDRTHEIIKKYANAYNELFIDISKKKNVGISNNYKSCIRKAKGKYIAILEGDDYWCSEYKIQKMYDFMEENNFLMAFHKSKIYNEKTKKFRFFQPQEDYYKKYFTGQDLLDREAPILTLSSCCFNACELKRIPSVLYNCRLSEYSLSFYFEKKKEIGFLNKEMTVYREHSGSFFFGSNIKNKQLQKYFLRKNVLKVCRNIYKNSILSIINKLGVKGVK